MDRSLRAQILRVCVRDRAFLRSSAQNVSPEDFPEPEEELVARTALRFYEQYQTPIGSLLASEAEDEAKKQNLSPEIKKRLKVLIDDIQYQKIELVSVAALQDKTHRLKVEALNTQALDKVLLAHEHNQLDIEVFSSIVDDLTKRLSTNGYRSTDYFSKAELKKRIERRRLQAEAKKYPALLIDPLDSRVKMIGRGSLGLIVAPYGTGKSLALLHIAVAYALQGLKVLYISLEDPQTVIEDRLDASLSGLPIRQLVGLPNKLTNRFLKFLKLVRGRIHIVDGSQGGWNITRIARAWEAEKQDGFTADSIITDYDDEIEPEKVYKGESARRFEFADIYRGARRMANKTDTIFWTAAQTSRKSEGKKIVTGADIAEDISKARKATFCASIGSDSEDPRKKYLYVIKHKEDRSRFAVPIYTDFECGIFYDRTSTMRLQQRGNNP